MPLLGLLEQTLQLRWHDGLGFGGDGDSSATKARDHVDFLQLRIGLRVVLPGVAPSALLALDGAERRATGAGEHGLQVEGHVPPWVEGATASGADLRGALLEGRQLFGGLLQLALGADDADEV